MRTLSRDENISSDNIFTVKYNGARYILDALHKQGVKYFFMVPGKLINPFMCCYNNEWQEKITPIVAAHEAGAGYMADGYARASGNFGVTIVIDGPGTVNAVSAIASAYADGSPVLLIAGQIPKDYEMKGAIQDSTQSGLRLQDLMQPITATAYEVRNPVLLARYFRESVKSMFAQHRKPAYLGIAKDALLKDVNETYRILPKELLTPSTCDISSTISLCNNILSKYSNIVILVGSRANTQNVSDVLLRLSNTYNIPVATTISAKGTFPEDHPNALGVFGYLGHQRAIDTILGDRVEILILLGFDATQWTTLAWHEAIKPSVALIQVDTDINTLDKYIEVDYPIVSDPLAFLDVLEQNGKKCLSYNKVERKKWLNTIGKLEKYYNRADCKSSAIPIHPARLISDMRDFFPKDTILIPDSGTARAFAGHYWDVYTPSSFFTNTTNAPMGWAVPASIGIKLALPERECVVVSGDGSMLMYGTEIQTAVRHGIKIIYVIVNNSYYGATYFNNKNNIKRLSALPTHNWYDFAKSLGLNGCVVTSPEEILPALNQARDSDKAYLIDVRCDHKYPTPVALYRSRLKASGVL